MKPSSPPAAVVGGALVLASAAVGATSAGSASSSYLQSPVAQFHVHHRAVQGRLRDVVSPRAPPADSRSANGPSNRGGLRKMWKKPTSTGTRPGPSSRGRRREEVNAAASHDDGAEDCPGTPFLWKIVEDATGTHVGFGLGTLHLPVDVVMTDGAYASVVAAIEDSCDVYGELHLDDPSVFAELQTCLASLPADYATVSDIPDESLRTSVEIAVRGIASDLVATFGLGDESLADVVAAQLLLSPLTDLLTTIQFYNTVEYREQYLATLATGMAPGSVDSHVLSLGRPAGGLEEVSTGCAILLASALTSNDLIENFDATAPFIEDSLTASGSDLIRTYRCGDLDGVAEAYSLEGKTYRDGEEFDEFEDLLVTSRNIQMAEEMNDILKASPGERVMFAVGALHWNVGNSSFEILLKEYGYSLERIPHWSSARAEDHSDEHCGVVWNGTVGAFEHAPEGHYAAPQYPDGASNAASSATLENYKAANADMESNSTDTSLDETEATVNATVEPAINDEDSNETSDTTAEDTTPVGKLDEAPSSAVVVHSSKVLWGFLVCLWHCI